jgi:hypothetical protein
MKSIISQGRGVGKTLIAMMTMFDLFDTYTLSKYSMGWRIEGRIGEYTVISTSNDLMGLFNSVGRHLTSLPKSVWNNKMKE